MARFANILRALLGAVPALASDAQLFETPADVIGLLQVEVFQDGSMGELPRVQHREDTAHDLPRGEVRRERRDARHITEQEREDMAKAQADAIVKELLGVGNVSDTTTDSAPLNDTLTFNLTGLSDELAKQVLESGGVLWNNYNLSYDGERYHLSTTYGVNCLNTKAFRVLVCESWVCHGCTHPECKAECQATKDEHPECYCPGHSTEAVPASA